MQDDAGISHRFVVVVLQYGEPQIGGLEYRGLLVAREQQPRNQQSAQQTTEQASTSHGDILGIRRCRLQTLTPKAPTRFRTFPPPANRYWPACASRSEAPRRHPSCPSWARPLVNRPFPKLVLVSAIRAGSH